MWKIEPAVVTVQGTDFVTVSNAVTVAGTTVVMALTSMVSLPAVENVEVVVPQAVVFHSVTVTGAGTDAGLVSLRKTVADVGIDTTVVCTVEGDMVVMKEEEM